MKKIIAKVVSLSIVFAIFEMIWLYVSPLIENSLAMNQMSYSFESNMLVQTYDHISNCSWAIYLLLTILVFRKEILKIYGTIKERKGETNEQI